jgi:hypothetical protein
MCSLQVNSSRKSLTFFDAEPCIRHPRSAQPLRPSRSQQPSRRKPTENTFPSFQSASNHSDPSIVVENANPCSANNAKNKRDALGGIQPFRNPRLPPQPPYAPDCSGAPTTTTTQTTTMMRYEQSTVTTSLTATPPVSTAYKTTYVTSTTTQSSSPSKSCPTIAATVQQSGYTTDYVLYISTCGRTLSYNNPANTNPPVVLAIRAKVLACEAARQCADAARNQGAGYLSFDLHWKFESGWQCVMFYGRNRDGKYWEVTKGVGEGYGYSL